MKVSILDLRCKMKDVLRALDRNESVSILYHGKLKGVIYPSKKEADIKRKVQNDPLFGMHQKDKSSVAKCMETFRGG